MVRKTYLKTIRKTLTGNISRFLVISLIVMLGVAFVSGLGTLSSSLTDSIQDYYKDSDGLDLIIKSKLETGFTTSEIEKIENINKVENVRKITSIDSSDTRVIIFDMEEEQSFHQIKIIEGREISNNDEILVDRISDITIGDIVTVLNEEYTVVGIVNNPTYYTYEQETSINKEDLNYIYYLDSNHFSNPLKYITTDLYVKLDFSSSIDIFSDEYEKKVEEVVNKIESINEDVVVLTLEENLSYALTKNYGEKITLIAAIFPLFFIAVAALVVYSTISRLLEEERGVIGCYRSLGISKGMIVLKYLLFTFFTCLIGSILGFMIGIELLPRVIYPAYEAMFLMPEMTNIRVIAPGIITAIIMIICLCLITVIQILSQLKTAPCNLLKPKSPKAGKKIFLEYIPFIWHRLKFKYKSSLRNIFRYKSNLIMTVISVAGSTALTFAGLGLYAIAISEETTEIPKSMSDSFALISIAIIAFAAILCILVIFNLTNMNIQERKREIASLRVLGYQQKEVGMYIYREINITTSIGVFFGLPLGYIFLSFIFEFLDFGNINNVNWYYYLITVLMVVFFVLLAETFLFKKIRKVDMNASLKSNE